MMRTGKFEVVPTVRLHNIREKYGIFSRIFSQVGGWWWNKTRNTTNQQQALNEVLRVFEDRLT